MNWRIDVNCEMMEDYMNENRIKFKIKNQDHNACTT